MARDSSLRGAHDRVNWQGMSPHSELKFGQKGAAERHRARLAWPREVWPRCAEDNARKSCVWPGRWLASWDGEPKVFFGPASAARTVNWQGMSPHSELKFGQKGAAGLQWVRQGDAEDIARKSCGWPRRWFIPSGGV